MYFIWEHYRNNHLKGAYMVDSVITIRITLKSLFKQIQIDQI